MTPEKNKEMTPETHIPIKISPRDGRIRISSDNGGTVFVKCKPDDEGDLTLTITTKGQEMYVNTPQGNQCAITM